MDMSIWGTGYFKISNVFSYGKSESQSNKVIIAGFASGEYTEYHVFFNFSNTYYSYREGMKGRLFAATQPNGEDGFGAGTMVTDVIKPKTDAEFATSEMAALLNNGRTGDDAPWEYVAGADYPTFKWVRGYVEPATLSAGTPKAYSGDSGGGCDTGLGVFGIFGAAGAMIFTLGTVSAKRRRPR
jgi:hypothetical protein